MHLTFSDRVAAKNTATDSTASTAASASKTASLARAFTTSAKKDKESAMARTATHRAPIRPSQISLPIALISTTNMLSYDAPDLPGAPLAKMQKVTRPQPQALDTTQKAMSVSSSSSPSDSSSVGSRHSNASTAATSLSVEHFGVDSPEQNHLTCYFKSPTGSTTAHSSTPASRADSVISQQSSAVSSPLIPSRATSHSKQAHVLSHKRSVSRVGLSPKKSATGRQDSTAAPTSTDSRSSSSHAPLKATTTAHPFGKELEQLNEIAEEFSSTVRDAEQDADYNVLKTRGLGSFCAAEYLQEIAPLYIRAFGEDLNASAPTWI